MELDLIEYLESKNFEPEEIAIFQKKYGSYDSEKIIHKLNAIYKIFRYANLTDLAINSLIINNIGIIEQSDTEIIKIAYSWSNTGVLSEACNKPRGLNYNMPLRIYLRNMYLNSGINYNKSPISQSALTMGEANFQNDYRGPLIESGKEFYPTFENLIYIYGKGDTIEEKQKYLEELLSNLSLRWYIICLRKEKEKNKDKDKEDQGYGSI